MQEECLFCKIINGEIPADFIYKNDRLVIFKDIYPAAPVHLLIVPRKHIRSINDIKEEDKNIIFEVIMAAKNAAQKMSISEFGYKLNFNVEKGGGQMIFHLHLHLLGGWK
ncbi:MAG: HIT domain-containing protein [Desulfobacterales bacterium]|nr:HIT domain-containing protein [Desulfobacterales bacterium]